MLPPHLLDLYSRGLPRVRYVSVAAPRLDEGEDEGEDASACHSTSGPRSHSVSGSAGAPRDSSRSNSMPTSSGSGSD